MKKILLLLLLFPLLAWSESNDDHYYSQLFGAETFAELKAKGEINRYFNNGELPQLLPEVRDRDEVLKRIKEIKPTVGIEVLLYYEPNDEKMRSKIFFMNEIYNQMHAISTLKGLTSFSKVHQKQYTLFKDIYVMDDNMKRILDPQVTIIPRYNLIKVFITDPLLGNYHGTMEYWMADNYLLMYIKNKSYIWWLFLPIVEPDNTALLYAFFPYQEKLVFYAFHWLKAFNLFGVASARKEDIYERISPIFHWFLRGINRE